MILLPRNNSSIEQLRIAGNRITRRLECRQRDRSALQRRIRTGLLHCHTAVAEYAGSNRRAAIHTGAGPNFYITGCGNSYEQQKCAQEEQPGCGPVGRERMRVPLPVICIRHDCVF